MSLFSEIIILGLIYNLVVLIRIYLGFDYDMKILTAVSDKCSVDIRNGKDYRQRWNLFHRQPGAVRNCWRIWLRFKDCYPDLNTLLED